MAKSSRNVLLARLREVTTGWNDLEARLERADDLGDLDLEDLENLNRLSYNLFRDIRDTAEATLP